MKIKITLIAISILAGISSSATNYYWVGGTGNWSDFSHHWATTSGGTTFHNQVPQKTDNVYFDALSFTAAGQTVTIHSNIQCADWICTGVTNKPTFVDGGMIEIYGSLTLAPVMTFNCWGDINFGATTAGKTITTFGNSIKSTLLFNGIGGSWTLQDALTTTSRIYFNHGILNTNNQTVNTISLWSNSGNARTLNAGSSTFNLWGIYPWYVTSQGMTMNASNSIIKVMTPTEEFFGAGFTYNDIFFVRDGYVYGKNVIHNVSFGWDGHIYGSTCNDVSFAGDGTIEGGIFHNVSFAANAIINGSAAFNDVTIAKQGEINGSNTFNNLTFSPGYSYTLQSGETQTITNSFTVNGNCGALVGIVKSSTSGSQATIAKASGDATLLYVILKDINAIGGAIFTANNAIDLGNNTGWAITLLPSKNLFWVGNGGNWNDGNHWSTTSGGSPSGCSPSPVDNVFFDANSFTDPWQTVNMNVPIAYCNNMTWTGVTNAPTMFENGSGALNIYGSLTLAPEMTFYFYGTISFEATTPGQTLTTSGISLGYSTLVFNGIGGEWTLQDSVNTSCSIFLNNGILNTNNQTVTVSTFYSSTTSTRTLNMGASTFNLTDFYAIWYIYNPESMTLNSGTSTINFTSTYGSTQSFYGGGFIYHDVSFGANGGVNGSNTFNNLIFSPDYSYTLEAGQTQSINSSLIENGNCVLNNILKSSETGIQANLRKASGNITVSYITLKDINAAGGATFTADNAIDLGNNSGWTINLPPSKNLFWVGNGGNWNDGNHWSTTSGGSPSGCSPSPVDNVFFDANSFTQTGETVTDNSPTAYCNNMIWTGVSNVPTFYCEDYASILGIYGSLTLDPGMTLDFLGTIRFEATSSGHTITTAGTPINAPLIFNGIGGGWTLQDELTTADIILNNGSLNTNSQTVNATTFTAVSPTTATLIMDSSTFNLSGDRWSFSDAPGMTLHAEASTINFITEWSYPIFYGGRHTYNNLFFNGPASITDGHTILQDVSFASSGQIGDVSCHDVTFGTEGYINSSGTFHDVTFASSGDITSNGGTFNNVFFRNLGTIYNNGGVFNNVFFEQGGYILNAGTFNDASFEQDGYISNTGTFHDIAFEQSGTIENSGTFNDASFEQGGYISNTGTFHDVSFELSGTIENSGTFHDIISRNNGMIYNNGGVFNNASFDEGYISNTGTFHDVSFLHNGTIYNTGGVSNNVFFYSSGYISNTGTFNNVTSFRFGYIENTGVFNDISFFGAEGYISNTGTINDISSHWNGYIGSSGTIHDVSIGGYALLDSDINGNGNGTFNNVTLLNDAHIIGNNTFNNLTFSPYHYYLLTSGDTQTIAPTGTICAQGTDSYRSIQIYSSVVGVPATISKASGTICWDYVSLTDITATGGATFNAGLAPENSQDNGGNTGWLFTGGCAPGDCSPCTSTSITDQPDNITVCEGSNAVFAIACGEAAGFAYQWQVNTGNGFTNINDTAHNSGIATDTLRITAANFSLNGYQYRCIVSGACEPAISYSATLTVNPLPNVSVMGSSSSICSGQTTTLTATGADSYSWSTGAVTNSISVSPQTNTTYTVTGTSNGCSKTAMASVTIFTPSANVGSDMTVCSNNASFVLNGLVDNATGGVWNTSGSGTFSPNANTLNATYTSSAEDITEGTVTLTLTTTGNGNCDAVSDEMVVSFNSPSTFGLLASGSINSNDSVFVVGDIGAINGVSSYIRVSGNVLQNNNIQIQQALSNSITDKNCFRSLGGTTIPAQLNGQSLFGGNYLIQGNSTLNNVMNLSGDTTSIFVFNIQGDLTVLKGSVLALNNLKYKNIIWNVSGNVNLQGNIDFSGIIISNGNIIYNTENFGKVSLSAPNGNITLQNNKLLIPLSLYSPSALKNLFTQPIIQAGNPDPSKIPYCDSKIEPPLSKNISLPIDRFNNAWIQSTQATTSVNCSGFNLYFEDEMLVTGIGFNDPVSGLIRQQTACAVFNYLATVINLSGIHPDILIAASETDGTDAIAVGSPFYSNLVPFDGGDLYKHITLGADPSPFPYDGMIKVDFGDRLSNGNVITVFSGYPTSSGGQLDLFSIILHETMHALGFGSFISYPTGASTMNGPYSIFDKYIKMGNNFLVSPSGTFQGAAPSDLISNQLFFSKTNSCAPQPLYSRDPFIKSSLSHFDELRSNYNFVMRYSTSGGDDRVLTNPEIRTLCDLGYNVFGTSCTNCPPQGINDFSSTSCGGNQVCMNVITNDIDPENNPISFDLTFGNNGILILNGGGSAAISGNQICYTPSATFTGTAHIQYRPKDALSSGNITDVYITVSCHYCPSDPCNLVCNGDMEGSISLPDFELVGIFSDFNATYPIPTKVDNWWGTNGSPDLFIRGSQKPGPYTPNQGIPLNFFDYSYYSPAGVNTYNFPIPNDRYVGCYRSSSGSSYEGLFAELITPLNQTKTYNLDLWVFAATQNNAAASISGMVNILLSSTVPSSSGNNIIAGSGIQSLTSNYSFSNSQWHHIIISNITPDFANLKYLIIEPVKPPSGNWVQYLFFDDVRLVEAAPPITITNIVNNSTPSYNQNITYAITVCNNGNTTANNVVIQDILPSGLTLVSGYTSYPNITIGNLTASQCVTVNVVATVTNSIPVNTAITNCAVVLSGGSNCLNNVSGTNCTDIKVPATDISVVTTVSNPTPCSGSGFSYSIVVSNLGNENATNLHVQELLPSGINYISYTLSCSGTYNNSTGDLYIPALAANTSCTLTITANTTVGTTGAFNNYATLLSLNQIDLGLGNNSSGATLNIAPFSAGFTTGSNLCISTPANPNPISFTYTGSTATTYSWYFGDNTAFSNLQNPIHSYTSPGIYLVTLTVTNSTGCTATTIATVTISPIIIITPAAPSVASGGNVSLTASGASTYVWSPATSLSSTTGATVTASPAVTTTYTVTGTNVNGCTGSATVTVTVFTPCPAPNTMAANYNTNTTLSGTGFWAASTLNTTITGNSTLTLNGIKLRMSQNFKITVTAGCTLKIINATNIWACTDYMWSGIEVQAGGRVEISGSSRIEDAKIAVHIMNSATTEAQYDIHDCTFNKNYKSLVVDPYPNPHSGTVYKTMFTSAPSTLAQVGTMGTLATLKNPYASTPARKANMGIELNNVNAITIGSATLGANIFKDLEVGIHSFQNTNLICKNNLFRGIIYGKNGTGFLQSTTGMGIWAEEGGSIVVGGEIAAWSNSFASSSNGIVAQKEVNVDIQNCTFNAIVPPVNTLGSRCIYIFAETTGQRIMIKGNTFNNFVTGNEINTYKNCQITIYENDYKKFNTGIYCLQNLHSTLTIEKNHFNNTAADNGYTAIRVQNTVIQGEETTIYQNDIANCSIGIKCTKINHLQIDQQNVIKFNLTAPPSTANFGIWLDNCLGATVNNNLVYKTGPTAGASYTNLLYGYALDNGCYGSLVTNNKAQKLNTGYRFAGPSNNPITFGCNFITKNYTGLELNATAIGNQGAPGVAQDNQWDLTNLFGSFGAKNITSTIPIFYTRGSSTPWGLGPFEQLPNSSAVNFQATVATNYNCMYGCANLPCIKIHIAKIAKKQVPYNLLSTNNEAITYSNTYYLLKQDSTLYQQGTPDAAAITNFKDSLAQTNIGAFYEVSKKALIMDTLTAQAINNAIMPTGCQEQSQKIVNEIYLRTWAKGIFTFTAADSVTLHTIADYTVEDCGLAVYDARVMLRYDKNDFPIVEKRMTIQNMDVIDDGYGIMYPNPANTIAYYETILQENEAGFVQLFDIFGNLISSLKLLPGSNTIEINLSTLVSGVYPYKVLINGELKVSDKLIIVK